MNKEMLLPEGKTCGDCYAYSWCARLFMCKSTNIECDYFPVRFKHFTTQTAETKSLFTQNLSKQPTHKDKKC
jgi:hypothetical protein